MYAEIAESKFYILTLALPVSQYLEALRLDTYSSCPPSRRHRVERKSELSTG